MNKAKVHTASPETCPISLTEYRADQEAINGKIDFTVAILQSLISSDKYQSKA